MFERVQKEVEKARPMSCLRHKAADDKQEGYPTVQAHRQWVKIDLSDIRDIEGWKEYVKIFTETEKIITLESLNNLENTLPAAHFLRVHKSFIIAKDRVQRMDADELLLAGNARVPVARARKREVTEVLFKGVE